MVEMRSRCLSLFASVALVLVAFAGRADAVPVASNVSTYTNPNLINLYAPSGFTFAGASGLPGGWGYYQSGNFAQIVLVNSPQFSGSSRNLNYTQFFNDVLPPTLSVQELAWNFSTNTGFQTFSYDVAQGSPGVYDSFSGPYSGPAGITPFVGPEPSTMVGMAAIVAGVAWSGFRRRRALTPAS